MMSHGMSEGGDEFAQKTLDSASEPTRSGGLASYRVSACLVQQAQQIIQVRSFGLHTGQKPPRGLRQARHPCPYLEQRMQRDHQ
jgi:hypothetical protein